MEVFKLKVRDLVASVDDNAEVRVSIQQLPKARGFHAASSKSADFAGSRAFIATFTSSRLANASANIATAMAAPVSSRSHCFWSCSDQFLSRFNSSASSTDCWRMRCVSSTSLRMSAFRPCVRRWKSCRFLALYVCKTQNESGL